MAAVPLCPETMKPYLITSVCQQENQVLFPPHVQRFSVGKEYNTNTTAPSLTQWAKQGHVISGPIPHTILMEKHVSSKLHPEARCIKKRLLNHQCSSNTFDIEKDLMKPMGDIIS